jgi:4-hydroxy-tetrahydrodipicolinate reductase
MRLAIVGYGRMGRMVEAAALERGHVVVARVDGAEALREALEANPPLAGAEVAVEFTTPHSAPGVIRALAHRGIPVVSGTTGWMEHRGEVEAVVRERASQGAALLHAPNFSVGVQLFFRLARAAGRLLEGVESMDVHVLEVHHRHKLDHPSGTARHLADILVQELTRKEGWAEGLGEGTLDPAILQVASVRSGENAGTHVIGIEGPDERMELRHEARGRSGFARGAVQAAEWIRGRSGVHTPDEWLADIFG